MIARGRHLAAAALVASALGSCALSRLGTPGDVPRTTCDASAPCDDQDPCTSDACGDDGLCVFTPVADGPSPVVHAGNCARETCASGALVETPDDHDVPDDGEPCTTDRCDHGKPVFDPRADGTACAKEGAAGTCEAGACVVACGAGKPACASANPCVAAACDVAAGACVFTKLHGVPVPGAQQTPGDCKQSLCVDGNAAPVNDDTDVPKTPNPCDEELCSSGVPSNPPAPIGAACSGPNGASVCDGKGQCVGCNVATDCAEKSGPCKTVTCTQGACGHTFEPMGFVPPSVMQTPDDCAKLVCDGQGALVSVLDATDDDDGKECTIDACKNGAPTHTPKPLGAACGMNGKAKCAANGDCVDCLGDGDCAGSTDCKTAVCTQGTCGFSYTPAGTKLPPAKQTPNDCRVNECDGTGAVINVADDTDAPVNACDACQGGQIVVRFDQPCALGNGMGVCSANATCVACNTDPECPPSASPCVTATCSMNACTSVNLAMGTVLGPAYQTPGDCKVVECDGSGGATIAAQSSDLPNDGNPCTIDTCTGSTPTFTPVAAGSPPPSGSCTLPAKVCDGAGACVQCATNANCTSPDVCFGASCCTPSTCASLGLTCTTPADGCGGALDCNGAQNGGETDKDCGGPVGACPARCVKGLRCAQTSDCAAGLSCASGVCCDTPCTGTCMACSSALTGKPDGTCAPALPDTDPRGQCPGAACVAGVFDAPFLCDGAGACTHGGGATPCLLYACTLTGCRATCSGPSDCIATAYCDAMGACLAKGGPGAPCTLAVECLSGVCQPANVCQ